MRKLINISEQVRDSYRKYFLRNCSKWISRNNLSEENLDGEFTVNGDPYIMRGQISDKDFLMENKNTGDLYTVEGFLFVDQAKKKQSGTDVL